MALHGEKNSEGDDVDVKSLRVGFGEVQSCLGTPRCQEVNGISQSFDALPLIPRYRNRIPALYALKAPC